MRVRHAEACRRAGDIHQAIASYRMAADLLLAVGCESRARGALKAALELDPKDPELLADLARLGASTTPPRPPPSTPARPVAPARAPEPAARQTPPPPLPPTVREPAWVSQAALAAPPVPKPPPVLLEQGARPAAVAPAPRPAHTVRLQAEFRRLAPNTVAFRLSPRSRWVLFTSRAPIQVRRVDSLESLTAEVGDFTLDITVEESGGSGSSR